MKSTKLLFMILLFITILLILLLSYILIYSFWNRFNLIRWIILIGDSIFIISTIFIFRNYWAMIKVLSK